MLIKKLGKAPNGTPYSNIEKTDVMLKGASFIGMLRDYMNLPKLVKPSRPLPTMRTDLHSFDSDEFSVVWFGHSSYLIQYCGFSILVDPILFGPISPVSWYGKGYSGTTIYTAEEIPDIDLLLITHDHYDHLSFETVIKLQHKIKKIIAPAGVGSHLRYWGFDRDIITELTWHQSTNVSDSVRVTSLPARHFSGRFLTRNKTLWTSYILKLGEHTVFIGGDSGYDEQFKKTADTYGPCDIAFIECGQYGKNWPFIHMLPEQTAQAASDLKAKIVLPVHWGKFTLAMHPWNEPIKRLLAASKDKEYQIVLPMIGERYVLGAAVQNEKWWDFE